jgi:hypothetical protein
MWRERLKADLCAINKLTSLNYFYLWATLALCNVQQLFLVEREFSFRALPLLPFVLIIKRLSEMNWARWVSGTPLYRAVDDAWIRKSLSLRHSLRMGGWMMGYAGSFYDLWLMVVRRWCRWWDVSKFILHFEVQGSEFWLPFLFLNWRQCWKIMDDDDDEPNYGPIVRPTYQWWWYFLREK